MENAPEHSHELFLIAHTHWDREWYLPFQKFRMHLVNFIDDLLDLMENDPNYRHFNLDGQTIVLEDYLEIRPENKKRIIDLVKSNRIGIGPWYCQPDEWTAGELLVRNLMKGNLLAEKYGGNQKIGYCPDLFGHVSQMPQILSGCEIDTFMFFRGLGDEFDDSDFSNEFYWQGPDGSKLLTYFMPRGYANAKNHPNEEFNFNNFMLFVFSMIANSKTGINYIGCGGDHYFPQTSTPMLIKQFNEDEDIKEDLEGGSLYHASLREFFGAIKEKLAEITTKDGKLPIKIIKGELRQGRTHIFEPGSISSRIYLKQSNANCWRKLCYLVEPLSILMDVHSKNADNTKPSQKMKPYLDLAWKKLLQNQPHDSICGCSVDDVHREMEHRFAVCEQICDELMKEHLQDIYLDYKAKNIPSPDFIKSDKNSLEFEEVGPIILFNPNVHPVNNSFKFPIKIILSPNNLFTEANIIHIPKLELNNHYAVATPEGEILKCDTRIILNKGTHEMLELSFIPENLKGMGYYTYYLLKILTPDEESEKITQYENEWMNLKFNENGTFDLIYKHTGQKFQNLGYFEDQADAGDGYDFYPAKNDIPLNSLDSNAKISGEKTQYGAEFRIQNTLSLPIALNQDRTARLPEIKEQEVNVSMKVWDNLPRIDFEVSLTNKIRDHRLRMVFPTPIQTDSVQAASIFDIVERGIGIERFTKNMEKWKQQPVPTSHMNQFVSIHQDKTGSLSLFNKGLPEYEARRNKDGIELIQTIFRGFRYLGGVMEGRGRAGSPYPTPDAQMLKPLKFEYALYFHENAAPEDAILTHANNYILPIASVGGEITIPGRKSYEINQMHQKPVEDQEDHNEEKTSINCSLISIDNPSLILTAIKPHEINGKFKDGEYIVRVYNPIDSGLHSEVYISMKIDSIQEVNMLETPVTEQISKFSIVSENSFEISIPSKKIITLLIKNR